MGLSEEEGLAVTVVTVGTILAVALVWGVVWFACIRSLKSSLEDTQEQTYMDPTTKPVIFKPGFGGGGRVAPGSEWEGGYAASSGAQGSKAPVAPTGGGNAFFSPVFPSNSGVTEDE
eukprot:m.99882 g.99882  ORF g.99882 m.99882 type:complete len:117 (-) comp20637_c0_seq1:1209-1559(-)